ncbi:hypothetical protein BKA70DRAFT_1222770 [Coprinopsis sp. MPI-PUGE-AT-0042]|nr:hypothetical protein BKA70DRAFT_1222770 [Coprinopsis sp. MPI-PUGE-AT-0042]
MSKHEWCNERRTTYQTKRRGPKEVAYQEAISKEQQDVKDYTVGEVQGICQRKHRNKSRGAIPWNYANNPGMPGTGFQFERKVYRGKDSANEISNAQRNVGCHKYATVSTSEGVGALPEKPETRTNDSISSKIDIPNFGPIFCAILVIPTQNVVKGLLRKIKNRDDDICDSIVFIACVQSGQARNMGANLSLRVRKRHCRGGGQQRPVQVWDVAMAPFNDVPPVSHSSQGIRDKTSNVFPPGYMNQEQRRKDIREFALQHTV